MLSAIKCIFSQRSRRGGRAMTVGGQCVTVYGGGNVGRASERGPRLISICASRCWLVSRPLAGHLPAPLPALPLCHCIHCLYINACLTACVLPAFACHAVVACQRLSLSVSLPLLLLLLLSPCLLLLFSLLLRVSAFRQRLKNFQFSVPHKRSSHNSNNNNNSSDVATFVCLVARGASVMLMQPGSALTHTHSH